MVYMDRITFVRACLNVRLKAPRLIPAFDKRITAFSSFDNDFPAIFGAKKSINSVSSCVLVILLFFASILIIGSFVELFIHFWTVSLGNRLAITSMLGWDTVLYTLCTKELWSLTLQM